MSELEQEEGDPDDLDLSEVEGAEVPRDPDAPEDADDTKIPSEPPDA